MGRHSSAFLLTALLVAPALAKTSRDSYLKRARSDIEAMTVQLHQLDEKIAPLPPEEKSRAQELLQALWKKERLARVQWEQLKKNRRSPETRWKKLRDAEDSTLIGLRKSYRYLVNHLPR